MTETDHNPRAPLPYVCNWGFVDDTNRDTISEKRQREDESHGTSANLSIPLVLHANEIDGWRTMSIFGVEEFMFWYTRNAEGLGEVDSSVQYCGAFYSPTFIPTWREDVKLHTKVLSRNTTTRSVWCREEFLFDKMDLR